MKADAMDVFMRRTVHVQRVDLNPEVNGPKASSDEW